MELLHPGLEGEPRMKAKLLTVAACLTCLMPWSQAQDSRRQEVRERRDNRPQQRLEREVRHELVMLPYYGVFDNLVFRVEGDTVRLMGQVSRPTLKSDAENVVKDIEGVGRVINEIEVMPVSPNDDRIRIAAHRAIFGTVGLDRYAMQAVPPIHIIVNNGNITLEGIVATEMDRNLAGMKAQGVPGAFKVTNNLRVESK